MALGHVFTCLPGVFLVKTVPKTGWAEDAHTQEGFPRIRPVRGEVVLLWDREWHPACGAAQSKAVAVIPAETC